MQLQPWVISSALALQLTATLFLTGLIWFVQIVHYPLFAKVGQDHFKPYHDRHMQLTTRVVAFPMLVEAYGAVVTALRSPPNVATWQAWLGLALVALIWASTAWLQVPQHRSLERGFRSRSHRRLVATNWIRTAAWSLRSVLLVSWVV